MGCAVSSCVEDQRGVHVVPVRRKPDKGSGDITAVGGFGRPKELVLEFHETETYGLSSSAKVLGQPKAEPSPAFSPADTGSDVDSETPAPEPLDNEAQDNATGEHVASMDVEGDSPSPQKLAKIPTDVSIAGKLYTMTSVQRC